jgi:hypothetical protein
MTRVKEQFIKGLGIPTDFKQVKEYADVCGNGHGGLNKVLFMNDTGGSLIYEKYANEWWVRYEKKVTLTKHGDCR